VKLPRAEKREMLFLTADQVTGLAAAVHPNYRVLVLFAAYTGLRAGEIGALRVGRLDFLRGRVDVVENLKEVRGRLIFGATKTHERRSVGLPRFLCDELGTHLAGRPHERDDLVFTAPGGGPLRHSAFYKRHYKPAVRLAGLPGHLRFHDLRHTAASFILAVHPNLFLVMQRLGHASMTTTTQTYGHLVGDVDAALAVALDEFYAAPTSVQPLLAADNR
jgi:integrase